MSSLVSTSNNMLHLPSSQEMNNNNHHHKITTEFHQKRGRSMSAISFGSISNMSDVSEDTDTVLDSSIGKEDQDPDVDDNKSSSTPEEQGAESPAIKRGRSMSDGFHPVVPEYFEVFPSLPDSVLQKMGLLGDGPRERLNEEELEQKFIALGLAFTIDAATIKDRCARQRRYRDQTEANLVAEIERLVERVNRLHPICVDAETTEILQSLLGHIDIVMRASTLATISAERYGAVQHEDRLAESVTLMLNHVNVLKQQRDSTRRQLQYTKRMLQDTNSSDSSATRNRNQSLTNGGSSVVAANRFLTRRRASIATITTQDGGGKSAGTSSSLLSESLTRKLHRRPSDLSLRGGAVVRTVRPTRLELGVDLVKIREGIRVENVPPAVEEESEAECMLQDGQSDFEDRNLDDLYSDSDYNSSRKNSDISTTYSKLSLGKRVNNRILKLRSNSEDKFKRWIENGALHEFLCFCALMCFSLSVITLGNILIELECAKQGASLPMLILKMIPFWNQGSSADIPIHEQNALDT